MMLRWRLWKIKSEKENVRKRSARRLGKSRNARSVQPLIAMLEDERAYVRSTAAFTLGWICDLRAIQPLLAALSDEDADVRDSAALALGMIRDAHTGGRLTRLLRNRDIATQVEAEEKLKASGNKWASETED